MVSFAAKLPKMIEYPKRLGWLVLWAVIVAGVFWVGSRYPQLVAKSEAGHTALTSMITLAPLFNIDATRPVWEQLGLATLNWLNANKIGMTFGVIFGAALLSVFQTLGKQKGRNGFLNSFFGMLMGAPLGVCVNCAAPIAKGMIAGGGRMETALATMISSPTLNMIVAVMLFSLFPLELVLFKYGFTLLVILVGVPLLVKWLQPDPAAILENTVCELPSAGTCALPDNDLSMTSESWGAAFQQAGSLFGKNLWYIFKLTVPFMFLAAFLTAAIHQWLPLESLVQQTPTAAGVVLVSAIGILLPLPMAFDVILTHSFYEAGAPLAYVLPLLFGFGVYSVYPFLILWNTVSRPVAFGLLGLTFMLAVFSGWVMLL
ncbi:MAG: permease [Vampirovibrio sp.]|nr:permease [Vampirovibrio sp.]